jgi:enterochelin esterase-like enzyme/outer membrane protein assembly factor BamB
VTSTRPTLYVCAALSTLLATSIAVAQEARSEFRGQIVGAGGPSLDLPESEFGLSLLWSRELGSGYSNISIAGGRAVTMFTAGESDVLAALDPATGEELWRVDLGDKYAGHDGSDDGPLSTPAIVGDRVFALSPRGRLLALSFADGSEIWRHDLDEQSSTPPFYGYTSSPITFGDLVFIATGGDGHAVTAFDQATGTVRWAAGNDSVSYQTPTVFELGGRPTLVAATDHLILGLDPQTGTVRFEHRHSEGEESEESAHVIPVDGQRFVVNFQNGAAMYKLAGSALEEVWRSPAFGNSLSIPVRVGQHLYGFTGQFLTSADLETGEISWRSRPPGARGLEVVDGRLAVFAASGDLVLIEPSAEGYREITRLNALESGYFATPAYANGVFLLRNLERMAAVRVDTSATPLHAETEPTRDLRGQMAMWVAALLELPEAERQAAVDKRFAPVEASPIFEDGGIVHFFWRGEAEDVGLQDNNGDIVDPVENGLFRIPGTDLFVRSAELDPKAQYTYGLSVDYQDAIPDPRNPYTVDNGFNVVSELRMPDWPASPHLEEPAEGQPRGEVDTFPFHSEILDNTRQIQVWRPAGYGTDAEARYPLLVVNHGDNLMRGGLMRNTLDNLVGNSVAPVIAVFVPRVSGAEYGGPQVDDYLRFLTEELIPHLDRHYLTDGHNRAIVGPGSAGVTAVYAALQHGDVFQQAATQSFYPIDPAQERLEGLAAAADPKPKLIYVVWSNRDYAFDPARRADEASKALVELLRSAGIDVTEQVADYSPGWGGWRGQDDDILRALFPMTAE